MVLSGSRTLCFAFFPLFFDAFPGSFSTLRWIVFTVYPRMQHGCRHLNPIHEITRALAQATYPFRLVLTMFLVCLVPFKPPRFSRNRLVSKMEMAATMCIRKGVHLRDLSSYVASQQYSEEEWVSVLVSVSVCSTCVARVEFEDVQ